MDTFSVRQENVLVVVALVVDLGLIQVRYQNCHVSGVRQVSIRLKKVALDASNAVPGITRRNMLKLPVLPALLQWVQAISPVQLPHPIRQFILFLPHSII